MKSTNLLMEDHKIILRCLNVLRQMIFEISGGKSLDDRDLKTIIRFLREFADEHHQAREESALFPEILSSSAGQDAAVRHMLFEHDQERSIVDALEDAFNTKHGQEFVYFANRFIGLIQNHIYKEDTILFPIADSALTAEQDKKVVEEMAHFALNPALMTDLCQLERRYLKKAA